MPNSVESKGSDATFSLVRGERIDNTNPEKLQLDAARAELTTRFGLKSLQSVAVRKLVTCRGHVENLTAGAVLFELAGTNQAGESVAFGFKQSAENQVLPEDGAAATYFGGWADKLRWLGLAEYDTDFVPPQSVVPDALVAVETPRHLVTVPRVPNVPPATMPHLSQGLRPTGSEG